MRCHQAFTASAKLFYLSACRCPTPSEVLQNLAAGYLGISNDPIGLHACLVPRQR